MEEDIEMLKEYARDMVDFSYDYDCFDLQQAIRNILNRLEQDEKIINDVASRLEYYLIGRLDLKDSQEEFKKLLKMLKQD